MDRYDFLARRGREDAAAGEIPEALMMTDVIENDKELDATLERVRCFRLQVLALRHVEPNPLNYRLSAGGYLAEIDRMNLLVREYLSLHPGEIRNAAA